MTPLIERICDSGGCEVPSQRASPPRHKSPKHEDSANDPRIRGALPDRRLSIAERIGLIVEILGSYAQARRAMRAGPIESAVAALRGSTNPVTAQTNPVTAQQTDARTLVEAHRLARAVQLTLRLLPGDTRCLTRSLVLTQLLARRAIPSKLVIGARPAPSFLAHAWVEYRGCPVLPVGDGSFGRLVEL